MQHCNLRRAAHVTPRHGYCFGQVVGPLPTEHCRDVRVLGSRRDYLADMLPAVFTPIPHEEGVGAVIRIPAPVHLYIAWVVRKLPLVFIAKDHSVARLRQETVEEFDVAWMKIVIEFIVTGMVNDQHAALL